LGLVTRAEREATMSLRATLCAVAAVGVTLTTACSSSSPGRPGPPSAPTVVSPPVTPPASMHSPAPSGSVTPIPNPPGVHIQTVKLSQLNGATVPTTFILQDDTAGVTESKFLLTTSASDFLASVRAAPFETAITVSPGPNSIEVRQEVGGDRVEVHASFTAKAGQLEAAGSSAPSGPSSTIVRPTATVTVSSASQLTNALHSARAGTVIELADGEYRNGNGKRWQLANSGTDTDPITLEGGRGAILESDSPTGDYGLWITGSHWQVLGITVRNASKGIVLDRSQGTIIDSVEVYNIGDEGVHFRTCSSDDVLQNSYIHDTGVDSPNFGEGAYVGSAKSNWSKYGCSGGEDKSENALIRGNRFMHVAAEGADLKEGTDSGSLIGNTFDDTGYSGQNSADSAVDVKGNNWVVSGNTVGPPQGANLDAFQTHQVVAGYGTANVFTANTVQGSWPGFGFGLYPSLANIVTCDNTAPDAVKGLVGDGNTPMKCAS
jgi:hypothetical protein